MKKILAIFILVATLAPTMSFAGGFDEPPFADIYNPDSKCWRGVMHLKGPSEQLLRQNMPVKMRESYATAVGVDISAVPSFAPFIIETSNTSLYDSEKKEYHFYAAAVYPLPGVDDDCIKAVPPSNPNTTVTTEGKDIIGKSTVGLAAARAAVGGAGSIGLGGIAGVVAGSNPNPDTPGDIKGTPLYSGSTSGNSEINYNPGPSGLAVDCNRGEPVVQYSTGKNGQRITEVVFQNNCGFDDLMTLINKIINFLLFVIATPLVAIGVCYAGFLYLTSGGSSEKTGQAKSILMNLVIGYIVALLAWVVVKTIMVSLGFNATGIFLEI
ncbi:MAG: pilin [Candidatus Paceibacterota bacterium]